jgi:predicted AlkP superfamily pyrophosphatase or phosphodiesterase
MRLLAALSGVLLIGTSVQALAQTAAPPRLVIVISVDQFGADLFDQYRPQFTGGLARLAGGTVFRNGYQGQAATETCPGHSTILTGALPARNGIIANSWVDQSLPREDKNVYCAEDERAPGTTSTSYKLSSLHLKSPTLGDLLKKLSPDSQNVAVAGKDRAAVMMSGHVADQRWYWDGKHFVTDNAAPVPRTLPLANAAIDRLVATAQPPLDPPPFCQTKAKPVALPNGKAIGTGRFARAAGDYTAFRASPELDGATLAIAAGLVQDLRLGQDQAPDILSVGLSATDYVGHTYGNEGGEMCLNLFSLDRELRDFFRTLDSMRLDYAVVLTADHGLEDVPGRFGQPEAAWMAPALATEAVGKAIADKLGISGPILLGGPSGDVSIDAALSPAQRRQAEAEALGIYRANPQVAAVFTKAELQAIPVPAGAPDKWTLQQRARASFDSTRSGDLIVILKNGVTPIVEPRDGYVATHGSPWDYDRRVPILFWRPGMAAANREEAVDTVDIMPTIAAIIGIPVDTSSIDGRCLTAIQGIACPNR